MRWLKITFLTFLTLFLIAGLTVLYRTWRYRQANNNRVTTIATPIPTSTPVEELTAPPIASTTPTPTATPTPVATLLPTINLDVPFTSQAPEANWDEFHGEACEEASILMAQWYAFGKVGKKEAGYANRIPVAEAEKSLVDIVAWERNNVSDWKDTTVDETVRIAKEHLGMKVVEAVDNPTASDMKRYLNQGKVIVIPAAGRSLGNPNFRGSGPPYHMLVIRGYNAKGFIANDPGTRNGEGYVYSESTIMNAIHDWTGNTQTINSGAKKIIVVGREP